MADEEEVVMTPLKAPSGTVIRVERFSESNLKRDQVQHIAGGPYKGIVISKKADEVPDTLMPEGFKEFNVDMLDQKTHEEQDVIREKRLLKFWFVKSGEVDRGATTENFFKKVIDPDNFPRDSIHFVIRVLKLMRSYPDIKKIELEMRPLTEAEQTERSDYVITKTVTKVQRTVVTSGTTTQESSVRTYTEGGPDASQLENGYGGDSSSYPSASLERRVRTAQDDAVLLREEGLSDATYEEALEATSADHTQQWAGSLEATPMGQERIQKRSLTGTASEKSKLLIALAKRQRVLTLIEDAYPNAVSFKDLVRMSGLTTEDVEIALKELSDSNVINEMESNRYVRIQASKKIKVVSREVTNEGETTTEKVKSHDVQVVSHIPQLPPNEQPSVAVITLLYTEKMAVDAMMDTKTTYVRYKTEGEGQVYTVGMIGKHRVVSTKLARIGRGQGAMMSAENSVTRLLGTFGKVEQVILVGIGGAVPHYTDDSKHVRLGDVVVSKAEFDGGPIYIRCNSVSEEAGGGYSFNTQVWNPRENNLEKCALEIGDSWERNLEDGLEDLQRETAAARFKRPAAEKDKLIKIMDGVEEEVPHPTPAEGSHRDVKSNIPLVHFGCVGAGEELAANFALRQDFALLNDVKVVDCGFEGVLESIDGNRKDDFIVIRGVADYVDGTTRKEWQAYASLTAASVMKGLLLNLPA